MEDEILALEFVSHYDDHLVPMFEEWIGRKKIKMHNADMLFGKVCEKLYGIRAVEDSGN